MALFGLPMDQLGSVHERLMWIKDAYAERGLASYMADNLITLARVQSFQRDRRFLDALFSAAQSDDDHAKAWKIHTYVWACQSALAVAGDFVECGVYMGLYAATMTTYLNFGAQPKRLYLYDTFAGLSPRYASARELEINQRYQVPDWAETVRRRFEHFPNVTVIQGVVPESLAGTAPERIAFLHLDMNAAAAEIGALEALFDRVSPGGLILLDDYSRMEQWELHVAHRDWWAKRGYLPLDLPTGQGLIVKRG